jgi:hypothetical protein
MMKKLVVLLACAALLGSAARAASPLYVSPDVPTDETVSGFTILPWDIFRYVGVVPSYAPGFTVAGSAVIDALHKQDGKDDWLFSIEAASDLGGALPAPADPRDLIHYDGATATYSVVFCGASVGIPAYANLDAVYQRADDGPVIVSFDVPTTIGAFNFDPADLVLFDHTVPGCGGWTIPAANPVFDASAAGAGVPLSANVIGADETGGRFVLAFDAPVDLGPPGVTTYLPGQLVASNGAAYSLFEPLLGWPTSSGVDGLSLLPNPGRVPATILVNKAGGGDLTISWSSSCSQGAEDYGIYEGTIGVWYSHTAIDCSDLGSNLSETITPAAGNTYYLVVARHAYEEGSYGADWLGAERPVGAAVCVPTRVVSSCPP